MSFLAAAQTFILPSLMSPSAFARFLYDGGSQQDGIGCDAQPKLLIAGAIKYAYQIERGCRTSRLATAQI